MTEQDSTDTIDSCEKGNILIADDLPENLHLLSRILTEQGHNVLPTTDGLMALETMKRRQPDLAILDILMPHINGFEICQRMKEDDLLNKIPVIFISALTETEDKKKAFEVGGVDYITKPFQESEVLARVQTHLALKRLQQKTEIELQQTQNKYKQIYNATNDGIVICDAQSGRIIDVNLATLAMTGYSRDTILQFKASDLLAGNQPYSQKEFQYYCNLAQSEGHQTFEWVVRRKSGQTFWVEINLKQEVVANQDVLILVVRDISERKIAVEAIVKSETLHKKAQEIAKIGHWEHDVTKNNLIWSSQLFQIFGEDRKTFKPSYDAFLETVHPDDKAYVAQSYIDSVKNKTQYDIIHRIITRDGSVKFLHERGRTEHDKHGEPVRSIGTTQDITQLKKAEQDKELLENQLRQAQKIEAIGTLAGGIAHDFNNILSYILGYADMALDGLSEDNALFSDIQNILKAGKRARDLVQQILTFSRQSEKELQPLKVELVVKEALKLLRSSIPTTIEIRQELDPESGFVMADPTMVHQIVMNLCTNAFHAMEEKGGVLSISLKPVELSHDDISDNIDLIAGHYLRLGVGDTGSGIGKIILDRIFDPYFTTKPEGKGTGLGLSIVHGIVKSLQGGITVKSEIGTGAMFQIYLPLIESTEPSREDDFVPIPRGSEKILVVDDDESLARLYKLMLVSLGYQVVDQSDSREALDLFQKSPDDFDLIMTDITMPGMTGVELSKKIVAIKPGMPILVCTATKDLVDKEDAKAIGLNEFAIKPVDKKQLALSVRKVLDKAKK